MHTLQLLRMEFGLTEQQLAQKLQVSKEIIYSIERNNILPDIKLLIKMSSFFDVTTDYLLGLQDKDQADLLHLYNSLSNISKGILLERALILTEEANLGIKKKGLFSGKQYYLC